LDTSDRSRFKPRISFILLLKTKQTHTAKKFPALAVHSKWQPQGIHLIKDKLWEQTGTYVFGHIMTRMHTGIPVAPGMASCIMCCNENKEPVGLPDPSFVTG